MKAIKFDFNNIFSSSIGNTHGVTQKDLQKFSGVAQKAREHLSAILASPENRAALSLEWAVLPGQDQKTVAYIQKLGN